VVEKPHTGSLGPLGGCEPREKKKLFIGSPKCPVYLLERSRRKWEDNIKVDIQEVGWWA
jgi:hypothetical protein